MTLADQGQRTRRQRAAINNNLPERMLQPCLLIFIAIIAFITKPNNMPMKSRLIFISFLLLTGLVNNIHAQQQKNSVPSDTLVVLWSSGDPEVAEKACLMYTHAAKKYKWFDEVILVVWGPSEKLLAENAKLKEKVAAMKKDGIIVEACVACSNMYGVTNELKVCEVDVKGMGVPFTRYLKRGYNIITY